MHALKQDVPNIKKKDKLIMALKNFNPDTYDYGREQERYDSAANGGEESFCAYMQERFDTPAFDWDRWDTNIRDTFDD